MKKNPSGSPVKLPNGNGPKSYASTKEPAGIFSYYASIGFQAL